VHALPYTPAKHFAIGKNDPGFRTKLAIGADLAVLARDAGFVFRAVCADSAYGDQDGFRSELADAGLLFVLALKPRRGTRAYGPGARTPVDAARLLAWDGPDNPDDWHPVTRAFRDGHTETWWAADAALGWWGPDGARRLVVATADAAAVPAKASWHLVTNLPRSGGPREGRQPAPGRRPGRDRADLRDPALDRAKLQAGQGPAGLGRFPGSLRDRDPPATRPWSTAPSASAGTPGSTTILRRASIRHLRNGTRPRRKGAARRPTAAGTVLAAGTALDTRLAFRLDRAAALVAGMVQSAPAAAAASPDQLGRGRPRPAPLYPE
jgi:hypothetical protein